MTRIRPRADVAFQAETAPAQGMWVGRKKYACIEP